MDATDDSWVLSVPQSNQRLREKAHAAFDPIWKDGLTSRANAYRLLAEALGVSEPEAHMKAMGQKLLLRVPPVAVSIRNRLLGNAS